jgi:hypothetical protein
MLRGGATTTGTVSLDGPAPSGGAAIALSSASTELSLPSSVIVPGGGLWLDQTVILQQSQFWERTVAVSNPALPVRIVLAWTTRCSADAESTLFRALVNDLDLRGFPPDGSPWRCPLRLCAHRRMRAAAADPLRAQTTAGPVTVHWGQPLGLAPGSAINMGPLAPAGTWTKLDLPLRSLDITADGDAGVMLTAVELAHDGGRVWFDRLGHALDCMTSSAPKPPVPPDEDVLIDDTLPAGASLQSDNGAPLQWDSEHAASGTYSLAHPFRG